jgi:hypothetical protein
MHRFKRKEGKGRTSTSRYQLLEPRQLEVARIPLTSYDLLLVYEISSWQKIKNARKKLLIVNSSGTHVQALLRHRKSEHERSSREDKCIIPAIPAGVSDYSMFSCQVDCELVQWHPRHRFV